ncbi:DUF4386 domain-containing protein [Silicimonas sp. MF1-12-2]|uniref:DUF4386 domain-containing protein n=1 Tax=Silicimonas sp. MF1-12-2 TaxID=3384793 RepID=UPI0039B44900
MPTSTLFRASGALYLLIIVTGLTSELALRGPLIGTTPVETSALIIDGDFRLRLSILADAIMISADVALAILFFGMLASAGRTLATLAAAFRLIQAAILGAGLTTLYSALIWTSAGQLDLAHGALHLHSAGYDLGLIFFGINSVMTGLLLIRHPDFPTSLGGMLVAAGGVYLVGSSLRVLAPEVHILFQPAYLITVVSETTFAVMLLSRGFARTELARRQAA